MPPKRRPLPRINLAGYTFSAWVLLTISAGSIPMNAANLLQALTVAPTTPTHGIVDSAVALEKTNVWMQLQGNVIPVSSADIRLTITAEFPIADPGSEGFTGTLFIDDIQLSPP